MDQVDPGQPATPAMQSGAGAMLRTAREAQGLDLAEVAARTRVPLRHLGAIERSDYAGLPSHTYAVGFAKAYARAVGADEVAVAHAVRTEVDRAGRRVPEYIPYQMADPARVPPRGLAIAGLGVALAILILVGLWYGTDLFRRHAEGTASVAAPVAVVGRPVVKPTPVATSGGQVILKATDEVWMRVYDADNKTLYLGTMKPDESYTVPADAKDPMINVGRPDKLAVTLNGASVPPLGTGERAIKDVKVGGTAIAARLATASPVDASKSSAKRVDAPARSGRSSAHEAEKKPRRRLTETQRANIDAAANPPPPGKASDRP